MTLDLPLTLVILALGGGLFAFASWRARQPADPMRVRMINYTYLQFLAVLVVLLMLAHVFTLMGVETGGGMR